MSLVRLTMATKVPLLTMPGCKYISPSSMLRPAGHCGYLQVLHLPPVHASVALPVLAGLSGLRDLAVTWRIESLSDRQGVNHILCSSIRRLSSRGPLPVYAFPEVSRLWHAHTGCLHCKQGTWAETFCHGELVNGKRAFACGSLRWLCNIVWTTIIRKSTLCICILSCQSVAVWVG
jgi:hypothetical protein